MTMYRMRRSRMKMQPDDDVPDETQPDEDAAG
jgi:translation initiation factor IF-1